MGRRILGRTAAVLLVVMVWLFGTVSAAEEVIESKADIYESDIETLRAANVDLQKYMIPWKTIKEKPDIYYCNTISLNFNKFEKLQGKKRKSYPEVNWLPQYIGVAKWSDKNGKREPTEKLYFARLDLIISALPTANVWFVNIQPLNSVDGKNWKSFLEKWKEKNAHVKGYEYKEREIATASGQKVYVRESWRILGKSKSFNSLGAKVLVLVESPYIPEQFVLSYNVNPGEGFGEQGHVSRMAEVDTFFANLSITVSEPVIYEANITNLKADGGDKEAVTVTTKANSKPGEDGGVAIPIAIVIASAAAAAALGAAGSSGKDEGGRQSAFRLYVYKDFGNRIKKGAPPVYVYARIAETRPDGMEVDRPDLTAQIRIFSETEGVEAPEHGLVNSGAVNYMAAAVYIPSDSLPDAEGVVAFSFEGEGGTFTERLIFVLVGEPYIEYPAQGHLDAVMLVNALFGGNDIYEVPFNLCDFAQDLEAGNITVESGNGDLQVSVEKLDAFQFKAVIVNHTPPIEPDALIASKLTVYMKITAQGETERAESTFIVDLYPEGISVSNAVIEDGCLIVDTCPSDDQGFFAQEIRPTRFDLACAYKDAAGNVIVERRLAVAECLDGENEAARNMLLRLPYQVNVEMGNDGIYMIEPQKTLPAVGVEYLAKWYVESLGAEVTTIVVNGEEIYCVSFTNPVGETVFQIPLNKALEQILDWFVPDEVKRLLNKLNKVEMPDHVPHSKEGEGEQLLQGRI